jgi:hypothetical protein
MPVEFARRLWCSQVCAYVLYVVINHSTNITTNTALITLVHYPNAITVDKFRPHHPPSPLPLTQHLFAPLYHHQPHILTVVHVLSSTLHAVQPPLVLRPPTSPVKKNPPSTCPWHIRAHRGPEKQRMSHTLDPKQRPRPRRKQLVSISTLPIRSAL